MSELRVDNIVSQDGTAAPVYSQGVIVGSGKTFTVRGNADFQSGANVSGVVTFSSVNVTSGFNVTGVVTATSFSGSATGLTGSPNITVTNVSARDVQVGGALTVTGNLTVNGTTTTIDTVNLTVKDNTVDLRSGNNIVAGTGGIRVIQTTDGSGNVTSSREIRYNHSTGKWEFTEDGTTYKNMGSGGVALSYFCGSF